MKWIPHPWDESAPKARHPGLCLLACLALTGLLLPAALGQTPPPAPKAYPFEGTWSVNGTRQALAMGAGRRAMTFYISGSLVLTVPGNLSRGFRVECLGYHDGDSLKGSCVWTGEKGDQIFSDLVGPGRGTGSHVVGTITGGTGRYAGITGHYEFDWKFVVITPDGDIQGWAEGLKGTAYAPEAPPGKRTP